MSSRGLDPRPQFGRISLCPFYSHPSEGSGLWAAEAAAGGRALETFHEGTVLIPSLGRFELSSNYVPDITGVDHSVPAAEIGQFLPGVDDTWVPQPRVRGAQSLPDRLVFSLRPKPLTVVAGAAMFFSPAMTHCNLVPEWSTFSFFRFSRSSRCFRFATLFCRISSLSSATRAWYARFRDLSRTHCSSGVGFRDIARAEARRVRTSFQRHPETRSAMTSP
uniref:Uncharacterized protein n=1 Tax=Oryza punctata TaxID=4537 RepID=A0A0E0K435_ORYPU